MATRPKVTLRFRGREMAHQDLGVNLLKRVEDDLIQYGHGGTAASDGRAADGHDHCAGEKK